MKDRRQSKLKKKTTLENGSRCRYIEQKSRQNGREEKQSKGEEQ